MDLSPDTDAQTPPLSLPIKPISFANGTLHHHHHHHHHSPPPHTTITYKECLRNHAATLGGHALDGCGEFMPSPTSTPTDPTSLKCAACGCHRNFHRRDSDEITFEIHHHHRTHPNSPPPQPVEAAVAEPTQLFSSAPHMLMALKTGSAAVNGGVNGNHETTDVLEENPSGRKRFRTKFSQDQKEKMYRFSEKLGWKLLRSEEALVEEFCNEIGVGRGKLKVWMHNNKHTLGKKLSDDTNGNTRVNGDGNHITNDNNNNYNHLDQDQIHGSSTNGSTSSSGL